MLTENKIYTGITYLFIDTRLATVDKQRGRIETELAREIQFGQEYHGRIALVSYIVDLRVWHHDPEKGHKS